MDYYLKRVILRLWQENLEGTVWADCTTSCGAAMVGKRSSSRRPIDIISNLLLQLGVKRYGHRIHAFCALSNHLHLALQVSQVSLSKIRQKVAFRSTRWINGRQGHGLDGV